MPTTSTITRYRGDTTPDRYVISGDNGIEDISTGFSFQMTLSTEQSPTDDTNQVYQINGTIFDGPAGLVDFSPSDVQADQTPATYYYDVRATYPNGTKKTIDKGKYVYKQQINKT